MPFFCVQVFDFCMSCLTAVGYFSYLPNIKKWISAQVSQSTVQYHGHQGTG